MFGEMAMDTTFPSKGDAIFTSCLPGLGRKFLCQIALGRLFKILDIVRAVMEICMCV